MHADQVTADRRPVVRILGTHGIPAAYGGFETAAENVAIHLRDGGWRPVVYCQADGDGPIVEDVWNGIDRVTIQVGRDGWLGTSLFDLRSIRHACRFRDPCITFGYNTAVFNLAQAMLGITNVINMDGIEWSRARWGWPRQAILYVNERIACWVGDALIADHPVIEEYLARKARRSKLHTITYGANAVGEAPTEPVTALGLEPGSYLTIICRPIPENSILELVTAFSRRTRGVKLAVLGTYGDDDPFHRAVREAASDEVVFVGSVYDPAELAAIRFHSLAYLHGHTVGGTNPSLVEAMAAGNPVLAHDNPYNRWVAADGALYFSTIDEAADRLDDLIGSARLRSTLSARVRARHAAEFTWQRVAGQYQALLETASGISPEDSAPAALTGGIA
ncbi:Glycosyltransferase involved in cell wall bisynthesis [Agromyces sp. CF514]|uniref:DUF1972 domain-containing protein n=1 Tax=Agromyces sp. CF514 TaxID=1881031 RepID=UPI0008E21AEB|nr:DUF1972 domain-containing protein [Agromyces sp. CF514]SFR84172.1 Glycosyltransferase involved in cell wall bisynthesis [Agromyces sp. CF514]